MRRTAAALALVVIALILGLLAGGSPAVGAQEEPAEGTYSRMLFSVQNGDSEITEERRLVVRAPAVGEGMRARMRGEVGKWYNARMGVSDGAFETSFALPVGGFTVQTAKTNRAGKRIGPWRTVSEWKGANLSSLNGPLVVINGTVPAAQCQSILGMGYSRTCVVSRAMEANAPHRELPLIPEEGTGSVLLPGTEVAAQGIADMSHNRKALAWGNSGAALVLREADGTYTTLDGALTETSCLGVDAQIDDTGRWVAWRHTRSDDQGGGSGACWSEGPLYIKDLTNGAVTQTPMPASLSQFGTSLIITSAQGSTWVTVGRWSAGIKAYVDTAGNLLAGPPVTIANNCPGSTSCAQSDGGKAAWTSTGGGTALTVTGGGSFNLPSRMRPMDWVGEDIIVMYGPGTGPWLTYLVSATTGEVLWAAKDTELGVTLGMWAN